MASLKMSLRFSAQPLTGSLICSLTMVACLILIWGSLIFNQFANCQCAKGQTQTSDLQFTILHTNDIHSHDESFVENGKVIGGQARLGHLIRTIRKEEPNVLVIDAGDIFQGTPYFKIYHGEVEVHLLNAIGCEFYTIGNHEFDEGPENLAKQLKAASFKVLSANLDCSQLASLNQIVKVSTIHEINGEKIGIVGAITPDLELLALDMAPVKLKKKGAEWFLPVQQEVDRLAKEGVNKIIVISHCGLDKDRELAKNIPQIDVIIGGHSHTRMEQAEIVDHPGIGSTMIVQTGSFGRALGRTHVAFDKYGKLAFPQTTYRLINITDKIVEDADLASYIKEKQGPVLELRNMVLGTAEGAFDNKWSLYPWDSALGDLVTDSIYKAAKPLGATICFENRGGIRGRIDKGPITAEKVEEILPFENRLTVGTISGEALLKVLEHSVSGSPGGKFLDERGIVFAYDPHKEPGHRVVFAFTQDNGGGGKPITPQAKYTVALNSYTFSGGEGYDFSSATDVKRSPEKISDLMKSFLKQTPNLVPSQPCRIAPVNSSILEVLSGNGHSRLHVHTEVPGCKIYLLEGDELGVEPFSPKERIAHKIPVPVRHATVLCTMTHCKQDEEIELSGKGNVDKVPGSKASPAKPTRTSAESSHHRYYTVLVVPPAGAGKAQVGAPVEYTQ
jgi:5'-nucleotidase